MTCSCLSLVMMVMVILILCLTVDAQKVDGSIMLALTQDIRGPGWIRNGTDYCSWQGVTCSSNRSVEALLLSRCQLTGNLSLVSELKSLKRIDLSFNNFQGPVPLVFGRLTEVEFLDLSMNKFSGSIPPSLGGMRRLRWLNLSTNSLTGGIPPELSSLQRLENLNLNQNNLEGKIPDELAVLESLKELQLSGNNLTGSIPSWVGDLRNLTLFTAYENALEGRVPESLGSVSSLQVVNLHSNFLDGPIPQSIFASGKLEVLVLSMNKFNGSLPTTIGKCKGLSNLRIGNNQLTGSIPVSIGEISGLTYFEANANLLSGTIVAEFSKCYNLTLLNLASNRFTGNIPSELGNLVNLQELIISGNNLIGDIPRYLLNCKNLSKLDASGNHLNGSIPKDICNMSHLQYLLLDQNSISGELPSQIGYCNRLLELQLGSNYLSGYIPSEIGNVKSLQIVLNLSFNHFHGPIPRELGKLDSLVSLDISNNQFSGNIPPELRGMSSLIEVNFSHNLFVGQIPSFKPFQKSPSSSFFGNDGLCGEPLNPCTGANNSGSTHHKVSYTILLAVIGSALAVFATVSVVVLLFMARERQEMTAAAAAASTATDGTPTSPLVVAGSVFVESLKQAIDFNSVVKSTAKNSNKLSGSTFSTVYKAVMPSGLVLSVRKLKSMEKTITHHQNKMIREIERLGRISHDNVMKPIGFVIYDDVALLLHHYYANGTLAQLLHYSSEFESKPDWPTRLGIAIGVAQGLAFIHHVAIIHLDISSANIFLDANFAPLLGEIEISKLLDPSRGTGSISAVAGSFGYIPPEYAYTMQVTAPGNVYSYGVVLLEILTSRLPVDEAFGEGVDLVKWVHSASLRGETVEQILDSNLSTISFSCRKQMLETLKVAMLCTDSAPARRPKMKKVIELLEEVKQS
ncbi:Leucine-rich repeat receptor-like tyrosine-protein kinase [Nymphaea thermarum]|nr:Leucine-rich repeat receptor-like tyrosine-protein kinase [Nymphaea thermarum]